MNLDRIVIAVGAMGGGDLQRTLLALVAVAVRANAADHDCPAHDGPCDCPTEALQASLARLRAIAGPIPLPAEPAP